MSNSSTLVDLQREITPLMHFILSECNIVYDRIIFDSYYDE